MGGLWHKPSEIGNVNSILSTKSIFSHLIVSDYAPSLYYKACKERRRGVGWRGSGDRDDILIGCLAHIPLYNTAYHDTVVAYEVKAHDPPLSLYRLRR